MSCHEAHAGRIFLQASDQAKEAGLKAANLVRRVPGESVEKHSHRALGAYQAAQAEVFNAELDRQMVAEALT